MFDKVEKAVLIMIFTALIIASTSLPILAYGLAKAMSCDNSNQSVITESN